MFARAIFVIALLASAYGHEPQDKYQARMELKRHNTYDFAGTLFFELDHGTEVAVVSVDSNTALGRFLAIHAGRKVDVVLSVVPRLEQGRLVR